MRKIKSLFKWAFAAALIFGSSGVARADYPAFSSLEGSHTFTSDMELVDPSATYLTSSFDFTLTTISNVTYVQGFLNYDASLKVEYDQSTGVLTPTTYFRYQTTDPYVYLGNEAGVKPSLSISSAVFKWQITQEGAITMPNFTLLNASGGVIARFNNVKIDAPAAASYPAFSTLIGDHKFKADLVLDDPSATYLTDSFTFTLSDITNVQYVGGLFNYSANLKVEYDEATGVLVPTPYFRYTMSDPYLYFGDADGKKPGLNIAGALWKWQITPEGEIQIPDFTIINGTTNTVIAHYTNVVVDGDDDGGGSGSGPDDTGDMGPEPENYPTKAQLAARGNFVFTADITFDEGMEAQYGNIVNSANNSEFYFVDGQYAFQIKGLLGQNPSKAPTVTYDQNAGTLTLPLTATQLQYESQSGGWVYLRIADETGNKYDTFGDIWADVDKWGRLTVKPFTLITDDGNSQIVAHFNNCRVNGFPVDGGGEYGGEEEGGNYPEASQLTGSHGWAANINVKNEELYNSYLVDGYKENTFTISYNEYSNKINVSGLLGSIADTAIAGTYNQKTGQVTFTNEALSFVNSTNLKNATTGTAPVNVLFNITNADAKAANGSWVWQVAELNEDGTGDIEITIPDFMIWNQYYENPGPIAEYVNFELDGIQVFDPDPVVPSDDSTTVGTYTWKIQYNNGLAYTSDDPITTIQVEVVNGTNGYFVKEAGETNYFQGLAIPFSIQDENAVFQPTYVGKINDQFIFSDIAYLQSGYYNPMSSPMTVPFNVDNGFSFKANQGVGFYTSMSDEEYMPENTIFACFVLPETYPTASQIEGTYKFTSKGFKKYEVADVPNSKSACKLDVNLLQDEFLFTISKGEGGKMIVSHMFYGGFSLGNIRVGQSTYDETTGQLTLDHSVVYDGAAIMAGIAPDGKWGGISAGATQPLVLQFHEDRSITVPMFQLVKYDAAKVDGVYAEYSGNKAVPYVSEAESGPIVSNPEIEGIWNIDYFDIVNSSEGGGKATGSYMAYLKGNVVTFQEQASGDASGEGTYHIIARFTDETTLLVERATVSNPNASQPLNQIPFTNGKTEQSDNPTYLNKEEWTFKYDAAAGTITPSGSACGVWYANFAWGTDNQTTEIQAAYIINGGKKASNFVPTVTISNMKAQTSGNSATISFNVAAEYWDNVEVAKWKAFAQTYRSEGETDIYEDYEADATVDLTAGTGQFTITGLPNGCAGFPMVYIVAYDKDGIQIAKSNGKSITFEINSGLTLSDFSYQMGEGNSSMTVTFRAMPTSPVNLSDFDSWTAYFRNDADGTTYALDATVVEKGNATIKYLEATVVFEELLPGQHDFYVRLVGYKGDAEVISNAVEYNWDADVQGVPQEGFGSCVIISNANAAVSEEGVVTVTFYIETQNVKEEAGLIYEAILTPAKVAQEGAENAADGDLTFDFTPAVDGKGTLTLDDLEAGTYAYNLTVNVYNEETLVAGTLEAAYITFIIQGEEPVDPDQPDDAVEGIVIDSDARYFNLQGLEIKNPEKGIYIKIENGKITKVVK